MCLQVVLSMEQALGHHYRRRGLRRVDNLGCAHWLKITSFSINRGRWSAGSLLLSSSSRPADRSNNAEHEVRHLTESFRRVFKRAQLEKRWVSTLRVAWDLNWEMKLVGSLEIPTVLLVRQERKKISCWRCHEICPTGELEYFHI